MVVGLSARTNMAAVDQLRAILLGPGSGDGGTGGGGSGGGGSSRSGGGGGGGGGRAITRVEAVAVPHGLHLKSACSALVRGRA
jgi:hypothetical protein